MIPKPSSPTTSTNRRGRGRPSAEETARLDDEVRRKALELFLADGYEGTSLDAIARAAHTTKVSLYARYPSKADLFRDVVTWAISNPDWPVPESELPRSDDLRQALLDIANASLARALHPSMVALSRLAVAQSTRFPELALHSDDSDTFTRRNLVREVLDAHAATGEIVVDDPEIASAHFIAMVAGMPARHASLGLVRDPEVQRHRTEVAVDLFVRGLRP